MSKYNVLITDYAWPSLDIERDVLTSVDARLIVAKTGDEAELVQLAPEADAILTCWKTVPPAALDAAPGCLIVSRYGIGLDNIPVDYATRLGIVVTNVPDFCLEEVSDHTLALLLACARHIVPYANAVRSGTWDLKAGQPMFRIRGQTLGLIGYGNIAQALALKASALGLNIVAYTPRLSTAALEPWGTVTNNLNDLLSQSDYVSIHAPLTPQTRGMIDSEALRQMKPGAYLINTSRGAILDEAALYRALTEGWIAGAALDVLTEEPANLTNPLLTLDNVIITPHAAFYSEAAVAELAEKAAIHVAQVLRGDLPTNIVNPTVLDEPHCRLRNMLKN